MKANIKNCNSVQDDDKIILSIGMIVKDEEKVLGRCLESLQPLMKAIKCELIIADTGSTDSTVEIAKKYTDNVFHFDWINDFAAARNSTLEKAKGQWFFFLDADEYLDEDIGEMVHFFKIPELRSRYKTLEIMLRSYSDPEKTAYQDGCLARFQRIDDPNDKVHFVGAVHEGIWLRYPLGYFSTILHHTGYCFSSAKQDLDKKERNLTIMREEYKKNPKDIRMLSHLIDGCSHLPDELERYISEALELLKTRRNDLYGNVVFIQAIDHYKNKNPDYALELCDQYFVNAPLTEKTIATLTLHLLKANILSSFARYEEAVKEMKAYIRYYHDYKEDKLDITDMSAHPLSGLTETEYMSNILREALCFSKVKKYDEAFDALDEFSPEEIKGENFKEYLGTIREISVAKKDYKRMALYYNKINKLSDSNKKTLALFMLEDVYYSLITEKERILFANDMINSRAEGQYIDLMKLVVNQDNPDFAEKLIEFAESVDDWTDGYSEVIYLAVKHKVDISYAVNNMRAMEFRSKLERIANANDDFAGYVLEYGMPESFTSSIKQFSWLTALYEKAAYRSFNLNDRDKLEMYNRFVSLLGDYVNNIYNPELLNDSDIEVVPPLHRFGYFMSKAFAAKASGDNIGYVREMKHALQNCESMREIVSFMLEQFKKTL